MKKASIVGFGDILQGDLGIGCYVLDALTQESLGQCVELFYLADQYIYTTASIYKMELCIIVQALDLGLAAGKVLCWSNQVFRRNLPWLLNQSEALNSLMQSLERTELIDGLPKSLAFVCVQPSLIEGIGISKEGRRGVRKAIRLIKEELAQSGFLSNQDLQEKRIYKLELLNCAA